MNTRAEKVVVENGRAVAVKVISNSVGNALVRSYFCREHNFASRKYQYDKNFSYKNFIVH